MVTAVCPTAVKIIATLIYTTMLTRVSRVYHACTLYAPDRFIACKVPVWKVTAV